MCPQSQLCSTCRKIFVSPGVRLVRSPVPAEIVGSQVRDLEGSLPGTLERRFRARSTCSPRRTKSMDRVVARLCSMLHICSRHAPLPNPIVPCRRSKTSALPPGRAKCSAIWTKWLGKKHNRKNHHWSAGAFERQSLFQRTKYSKTILPATNGW